MAYTLRCKFDRIRSYAQAVKTWRKAVIFPKDRKLDPTQALLAPRGLVDKRKKHLTIERRPTEDIVLRLYNHPVVTWHKDGSITICAYRSRSTAVFANHCMPISIHVSSGEYFTVTIHGRIYKVDSEITFRERNNTWKADEITPWSVPVVNRERAKQAFRETGYEEFRSWFKVYVQMATRPNIGRRSFIDNPSLVVMLRDRNRWRDLIACRFPEAWSFPDRVLQVIRQAIYHECGCIEHKSVPFLG